MEQSCLGYEMAEIRPGRGVGRGRLKVESVHLRIDTKIIVLVNQPRTSQSHCSPWHKSSSRKRTNFYLPFPSPLLPHEITHTRRAVNGPSPVIIIISGCVQCCCSFTRVDSCWRSQYVANGLARFSDQWTDLWLKEPTRIDEGK